MPSVPTYETIVAKYDLGAILTGGDFQLTPSGNIAVMSDGNPKWGDDKCNAMHWLLLRWCFNARIVETLFTLVAGEGQRSRQAEAEREAVARVGSREFHALSDEMGAGEFGAAACAGAIMVVLSNLLLSYKKDLEPVGPKWKGIDPQFSGYSFGEVAVAAANNFRHHDEWARTQELDERQQKSIAVIKGALNYTPLSHAIEIPWRRNACADLTAVIGGSDFAVLEQNFFTFAKAMCA
jgi:hypothetical protein